MMEEYTKWCDSESNEKEDAITSNKRTIGDLGSEIADATARISELSTEVEELAGKISSTESELKGASELRKKEAEDFQGSEAELVETIDGLERAVMVIKRGQVSFLQRNRDEFQKVADGLSNIIEASWVSKHDKAAVQALLQSNSEDSDEDLSLQPQASTSAYEGHGGGILDTLTDMKAKGETTLSDARTAEMKAQHSFEMLKQSLEMELSTMEKRMSEATTEKSGVEVFLQVSTKAKVRDDGSDTKRERIMAVLAKFEETDKSYFFAQVKSEAREGPFDKVKGLIESMIMRLEKQAAEEAEAKAFCDTETSKSKAKQAELTATSDKSQVRIEKATATIAELKEQIKTLQAQMAEMDAAQAEATALRNKEHEEYLKSSKDFKDSAEAVAGAIAVLQEYYSSGSFVQAKQAPELGGAKTDIADTIMSMLEVAESDFTSLLAEAEASEKAAQSSYDKLTEQNTVTKTANTQEVKGMEGEVKSQETALLNYKEDFATTGKELDAVLAYLDKLKPQCETKVMSYAERVAKREAEIESLKEALEILSA